MTRASHYVAAAIAGSVLVAVYETIFDLQGLDASQGISVAWTLAFSVLLVLWIDEDRKGYPDVEHPFDFGYLLFLFWPIYLPYYLWNTRRLRGILILIGWGVLVLLTPLCTMAANALAID